MVITNPGELHQGYFTVGGNWEGAECGCFLQGTSQASSHLAWLCFSLWTPPLLPSGADLAFWGPLFTFSSNSCTHTHTPENSPALILLLQPWLAYADRRSWLNLELTTSLGRSWGTGCLRRSVDTLVELAAHTGTLNEGTMWWLGWKLSEEGDIISKPKHQETGSLQF